NGKQEQQYRNRARAGCIDRPAHPLQTLRHDHSWICLAIIEDPPLPITWVFPTSFDFFSCHISSRHLTMIIQSACKLPCMPDFCKDLCNHTLMKYDLRISVKDYRRGKNLKIQ